MTAKELQETIREIVADKAFGIEMFALLQVDGKQFEIKKFQINDSLQEVVKNKLSDVFFSEIISGDFNLISIDNIDEKTKEYYEIIQDKNYFPFNFLNVELSKLSKYSETEQQKLKGFFIKINRNDKFFWIYQHKYPTTLINRSCSIFAIFNGDVYEPLDCDVMKLESKIDVLVIGNSIVSKNLNLLQSVFGFEEYIRTSAKRTIDAIESIDIVVDMKKLIDLANQSKLTIAKKLMKASNSPVLKMKKTLLINKLKKHDYYKRYIKIDTANKKIILSSQKDVNEFLKMLNDEILKSELTGNDYESLTKSILESANGAK